jgi:hypothetical protein
MMMVQRRLLTRMSEETVDKAREERRMLVSPTTQRTEYPGMIDSLSETRESIAFFDAPALGRRWGDELIAAFLRLADCLRRA